MCIKECLMMAFQAGHRQPTPQQPKRRQLCTVLPQGPRPHNSTGPQLVSRVQRVSFDPNNVTVYPADDYDRTPTWMYIALDRARFQRRIQRTELILSPILSDVHTRCVIITGTPRLLRYNF